MKLLWTLGAVSLLLAMIRLSAGYVSPVIVRECVNTTEVGTTELALFYATDFQFITTPVKCYIGCLVEKSGLIKDGRINEIVIYWGKDPAEADKLKEIMKICDSSKAEGECEPNFQAFRCWMMNALLKGIKH